MAVVGEVIAKFLVVHKKRHLVTHAELNLGPWGGLKGCVYFIVNIQVSDVTCELLGMGEGGPVGNSRGTNSCGKKWTSVQGDAIEVESSGAY